MGGLHDAFVIKIINKVGVNVDGTNGVRFEVVRLGVEVLGFMGYGKGTSIGHFILFSFCSAICCCYYLNLWTNFSIKLAPSGGFHTWRFNGV